VSDGYPKPISNWEGIPNNVDDALQYSNGFTYFFKDGKYWRFNDKKFQVRSPLNSLRIYSFDYTVKLGYNELGYYEHPVITNEKNPGGWFQSF